MKPIKESFLGGKRETLISSGYRRLYCNKPGLYRDWSIFAFTERFPDVASLAVAEEDEVLKYWQGLGYYSRARNLHAAAKSIMERFNGVFPENYKEVLSLKGIGSIRRRRSSPLLGTNRVRSWMEMCTGYFPVCLP